MKIEVSDYIKGLTKDKYAESYVDDRDKTLSELRDDYEKYKNFMDKLFRRTSIITFKYFNGLYECESYVKFVPLSFFIYTSQGNFHKGLRCDVILNNFFCGDKKDEWKKLSKDHHEIFRALFNQTNGEYMLKTEFMEFTKVIGLRDYTLDINEIMFTYDE